MLGAIYVLVFFIHYATTAIKWKKESTRLKYGNKTSFKLSIGFKYFRVTLTTNKYRVLYKKMLPLVWPKVCLQILPLAKNSVSVAFVVKSLQC